MNKSTKWKWVRNGSGSPDVADINRRSAGYLGGSDKLFDVGILADGTLHNPNGYPEDVVRSSVLAANERRRERRSEAAKKAAATRAARLERKIYEVAKKLGLGHRYGPRTHCIFCRLGLTDPQSIERGIGSDCWQKVMVKLSEIYGQAIAEELAEAWGTSFQIVRQFRLRERPRMDDRRVSEHP